MPKPSNSGGNRFFFDGRKPFLTFMIHCEPVFWQDPNYFFSFKLAENRPGEAKKEKIDVPKEQMLSSIPLFTPLQNVCNVDTQKNDPGHTSFQSQRYINAPEKKKKKN